MQSFSGNSGANDSPDYNISGAHKYLQHNTDQFSSGDWMITCQGHQLI